MTEKKRILICDDEEGVRESLNLILEKKYDCSFAVNGEEALKRVRENPVSLIILDIKMPRMDGIETLKKIKEIDPGTKVIIATGYKSVETATEAVKCGASDYIVKPFESKQVLEAVAKHIQ